MLNTVIRFKSNFKVGILKKSSLSFEVATVVLESSARFGKWLKETCIMKFYFSNILL